MLTVYGIPNCDTVKKARLWLEARGIAYHFHDFKKAGLTAGRLTAWSEAVGFETLVNRKGTTYRALSDADKQASLSEPRALALLLAQPSMIKRPVIEGGQTLSVGFKPEDFEGLFG